MTDSPEIDVVGPADLTTKDPNKRQIKENLERFEHLFGTDEDAFEQPTTSRRELWSYYLYYNGKNLYLSTGTIIERFAGDNGVGPISYSQAL